MKAVLPQHVDLNQVDIWFQDETRIGQQGSQTRLWAKRGTRPRVVKQQQFLSNYIFGAVCPAQQMCVGLVLPFVNHHSLQAHLDEIALHIPQGRHAVLVMDRAGWHVSQKLNLPPSLSLLYLPPYSPELNPQESVWRYLKNCFLSNRTFLDHEAIIDACCQAWNYFANSPSLIASLTTRAWATII